MNVKLLTKHHLEFLGLKGDYIGSSESIHVKMPHCWKSHATAHLLCNRITSLITHDKSKVDLAREPSLRTQRRGAILMPAPTTSGSAHFQ